MHRSKGVLVFLAKGGDTSDHHRGIFNAWRVETSRRSPEQVDIDAVINESQLPFRYGVMFFQVIENSWLWNSPRGGRRIGRRITKTLFAPRVQLSERQLTGDENGIRANRAKGMRNMLEGPS